MLLARRKAVRLSPTAERAGESRGYVAGLDYMTGLPPDNDGNTALLGMVVASRKDGKSVAWYQPVKTHSGPDAIAAFTECEHRISLMFAIGEFKLSRVHSDCEPSLIGSLVTHLKSRDLWMTRTEGYDHNGAGVVENRNRILLKGVRSALLTATGGRCRYTEVWGSAFMATNDVINHTAYAGEKSPVQNSGGISFDVESKDSHIYGARVVRYQAQERRDEKLDVSGRLSMYAGRSFLIPGGHRVIDLTWNQYSKRFDLSPTLDVKTVVVDNTSFPLKLLPIEGVEPKAFDHFIDMFDPRSTKVDVYEVQKLLDHRGVHSTAGRSIEYLVKWKGYHQREATWEPERHLTECGAKSIVDKYKSINVSKVLHVAADPDYLATAELTQRHKLTHSFDKCMAAYKLELNTVIDLRMTELFGDERERVLREEKAVRLRMNPEPKDDGRLKMRLLARGDCEPAEWTANMSLDSPTPASSSIKMMVAMSDETEEEEELSLGDITTAFLKGEDYKPTDRPRYVAYQQYRGASLRVFKLRGSLYGQRGFLFF
jgi:hypothetical protein